MSIKSDLFLFQLCESALDVHALNLFDLFEAEDILNKLEEIINELIEVLEKLIKTILH